MRRCRFGDDEGGKVYPIRKPQSKEEFYANVRRESQGKLDKMYEEVFQNITSEEFAGIFVRLRFYFGAAFDTPDKLKRLEQVMRKNLDYIMLGEIKY